MKKIFIKSIIIILSCIFMLTALTGCTGGKQQKIVVGAKDYTEQDILGNILSIMLKNNTELDIEYKHEMSSNVVFSAIKSGDVDLCIDYTGTIYGNYLEYSEMKNEDEVLDISIKEMDEKFNLSVLSPLGFNNTYCLAVRPDTAQEYNLKTYSDLAKVSKDMVFGGTFEILNRNDGIPNLKKEYDMVFKKELALEGVLRYTAIENDETQITEAFSTDGMLEEFQLVVLEDDKNFFPPYHAVPVIRKDTADKYPEVLEEIKKLAGAIDDVTMRGLNYKVDVLKEEPGEVAQDFLIEKGLIGK